MLGQNLYATVIDSDVFLIWKWVPRNLAKPVLWHVGAAKSISARGEKRTCCLHQPHPTELGMDTVHGETSDNLTDRLACCAFDNYGEIAWFKLVVLHGHFLVGRVGFEPTINGL